MLGSAVHEHEPTQEAPMLYRHGDVLIDGVPTIPAGAQPRSDLILAYGEMTGHSHRVEPAEAARLFEHETGLYLQVTANRATVVHEEHGPIALDAGCYRVWRQREYTPRELRVVVD
jgi:hypothetical protein